MRVHGRQRDMRGTTFIEGDTAGCKACGDCVDACRQSVLQVKGPRFHRHVHFVDPEACIGCLLCIKVCSENVFIERSSLDC